MLNIENLHALYQEGSYGECLESTNLFLLVNEQNIDALLLKAKSEYQLAVISRQQEEEEKAQALYENAYENFNLVLTLSPNHEEAKLYVAYIDIFIHEDKITEAIDLCKQLGDSADLGVRLKAIGYRFEAWCILADFDQAIKDLDELIGLTRDYYVNDRGIMDQELGWLHFQKGNIYLEEKGDVTEALKVFAEAIKYKHDDFGIYEKIANLAFDHNQFDFGGQAACAGLLGANLDSSEAPLALYQRIDLLVKQGNTSKAILESMFISLRIYAEELNCDTVEMLSIAQKYIKQFPDWRIPYNYAGAALYDAESYKEALPYLEKNHELGGSSYGVQRYVVASYYATGQLPIIEKWPEGTAPDYYNAGVYFYEFEQQNKDQSLTKELLNIRAGFYKAAYEGFYDYFYNGKGSPENNHIHIFAMCCNNYGIALREQGQFEKAVDVHRLGYKLSPFWEQLYTCGCALMDLKRYEEALTVLNEAAAYGSDYLDFSSYIDIKGYILDATYELGRIDETWEILKATETEYDDFMKNHKSSLSEEELFGLTEHYITVQNVRSSLLQENSVEDAIKVWQDQVSKNPEDNSNWFMLMQNYYQAKDYRQCIACADNYEMIKKDAIKYESSQKVHFMRGMSYLMLENFAKAKEDLAGLLAVSKPDDETQESIIFDANFYLAKCCLKLNQLEECMNFAWDAIAIYNNNGWTWDDQRTQVTLIYADACMASGEKKAAIDTVNSILEVQPNNEEARKRKKEWASGGLFSFLKRK